MDPNAILASVGAHPAKNSADDQQKIIALLNSIGPGDGGPTPKIDVTPVAGRASSALVDAIRKFQSKHRSRLGFAPDARVDPNGKTWRLLKEFSKNQHGGMGVEIAEAFPGIDISWWNEFFIKWLKNNTNLMWIGYYLPYAKYSEDPKQKGEWAKKFDALKEMGWFGIAPIFFGMQPRDARNRHNKGVNLTEIGKKDGELAASLALTNAIPRNTTIFCDREGGDNIPVWIDYYSGWVTGLVDHGYHPGLYGSYQLVDGIVSTVQAKTARKPEVWAVNVNGQPKLPKITSPLHYPAPPPRNSGAASATSWQFTNAFQITWLNGMKAGVDLDSSVYSDPGRRISPWDRT